MKPTAQTAPRAKSNAERQAAYRQRHLTTEGSKARLDLVIDYGLKLALARLAHHQGVTQVEVLEMLIREELNRQLFTMTAEQQNAFFDAVQV